MFVAVQWYFERKCLRSAQINTGNYENRVQVKLLNFILCFEWKVLELAKREFAIECVDVRYQRFGRFSENRTPISVLCWLSQPRPMRNLISLERVVRRERQTPCSLDALRKPASLNVDARSSSPLMISMFHGRKFRVMGSAVVATEKRFATH